MDDQGQIMGFKDVFCCERRYEKWLFTASEEMESTGFKSCDSERIYERIFMQLLK